MPGTTRCLTDQAMGTQSMTEKNHLFMGLDGKVINIRITTTSKAMAATLYAAVETALINTIRIDLEEQWKREGGSDG